MARLSAAERNKLPKSAFALPEKDGFPVNDAAHAKAALSRGKQFASPDEQKRIVAKVKSKFPSMAVSMKPTRPTVK